MGHAYPNIIETFPNSQIYAIQGFSPLKLTLLYDNYVQLIAVSIVGATLLSFYLYISSFIGKDKILAKGGNTGNHIYDFFIGKKKISSVNSSLVKYFLFFPVVFYYNIIILFTIRQMKKEMSSTCYL